MAEKPLILLVHGIGVHPVGVFKNDFVDAMNIALQRFAIGKGIEDFADVQEFNYDGFFDEIRQNLAKNANTYNDMLGALQGTDLLNGAAVELVSSINGFQQSFGSDKFFSTHVLDIILYGTYLGEKVRLDLAGKLAAAIVDNVHRPKHFITHSLGTAVLHDTLTKLYRWNFDDSDDIPDLHPVTHKLDSIFMVANVSRPINALNGAITGIASPYNTLVRGGAKGCTDYFYNIRHRWDPVTWPLRYDAHNSDTDFDIETDEVRTLDTHDFGEYIQNPKVAIRIARRILQLDVTDKAYAKARRDYDATTAGDAYAQLQTDLAGLQSKDLAGKLASFQGLLEAIKTLRGIVKK